MSGPATSGAAPLDRLSRIGVIGAGQMGGGIAHVCALAELDVVLTDISEDALQRGRDAIDRNMARQVARGRIREDEKDAAMGRIAGGLDYYPGGGAASPSACLPIRSRSKKLPRIPMLASSSTSSVRNSTSASARSSDIRRPAHTAIRFRRGHAA